MLQAMFNGVSAISANQADMDVIGNNIANVDTTAFKSSSVTFADQLSQTIEGAQAPTTGAGATDPQQIGLGVKIGSVNVNDSQGGLLATTSPTDMAIQGNGYFMTGTAAGAITYQRDGSFALDSAGDLVDAGTGQKVLGYVANSDGVINPSTAISSKSGIQIPVGTLTTATATANVVYSGNLDGGAVAGSVYTRSVNVYDSLGTPQTVTMTLTKDATTPNTWDWTTTGTALGANTTMPAPTGVVNQGTVTFNSLGVETASTGAVALNSTDATNPQSIALNFSGVSQFAGTSTLAPQSQDGTSTGTLQSFTVDATGVVTGIFSNGQTQALGQVALANFSNPGGLASIGNNQWEPSANSGTPVIGQPNTNGLGSISSGYLEQSNVDLGTELTNMIVTERAFQANTKIVSTVDEMLNDLIQMKQS
jgi:flagellar hook protein FlgE